MITTLLPSIVSAVGSHASFSLAQTASDSIPPEAYRRASSLTMMFAILGILFIMSLALIVIIRRNRRRKESMPKPDSTEHVDAWAEAGRRIDDSIVEIDPDDDEDEDE